MANEALVNAVKQIMGVSKSGDTDGANALYAQLFSSADFQTYRPEDQRQALKLFVLAKRQGALPPSSVETHRAALAPLVVLVAAHSEPADYEMLGVCQVVTGDETSASTNFRAGLEIERAKDADSDLCGRLMKHVSSI